MTESRGAAMQGFQAAQRLFSLAVDASPEEFDKALGPLEKTDLTQVRDTKRRSLLHVAAASGNDKLLKHLVEKHAFPADLEDEEGEWDIFGG